MVEPAVERRAGGRALLARTALFFAFFVTLQAGWISARGSALQRLVIDVATVLPAELAVNALTPQVAAVAVGSRLTAQGGGINILNGCEGTEVLFLLLAGLFAFPLSWRRRLLGALVGTVLVYGLNQVRILALFYAYRSDRHFFDLLHGTVAPVLLIALTALFFLFWMGRGER